MVLEILASIQKYVVVLLLLIAGFMWLILRKKKGEDALGKLRINRVYTIIVLMLLPYLVDTFSYFSGEIADVGKSFLTALIFLAIFIVLFKLHRKASAERIKDLKDLLKESSKHPIRYEFARKIVAPEVKILLEKEKEISKRERSLAAKNFAQEKVLQIKEKNIDNKIVRMDALKQTIDKNFSEFQDKKKALIAEFSEKRAFLGTETEGFKKRDKDVVRKETEIARKDKDLASKIEDYKKRKAELDEAVRKHNEEADKRREEILSKVKNEEMRKVKNREKELDILEAEILSMKRDVQRREKNLNPRSTMLESKEREVENRLSKIRMNESEIREELDNLKILKRDFAKDARQLKEETDQFADIKDDVESRERRIESVKESYNKKNERIKQKEAELHTVEEELYKKRKNLEALEADIAKRSKDVTTMQMRLEKKTSEAALEEGKKATDDDIGDLVSEKTFKKNGKSVKVTRRKLK